MLLKCPFTKGSCKIVVFGIYITKWSLEWGKAHDKAEISKYFLPQHRRYGKSYFGNSYLWSSLLLGYGVVQSEVFSQNNPSILRYLRAARQLRATYSTQEQEQVN